MLGTPKHLTIPSQAITPNQLMLVAALTVAQEIFGLITLTVLGIFKLTFLMAAGHILPRTFVLSREPTATR